jgi:putative transposase
MINKAYKVEIKPNNKQITHLLQHCGCARLAYNWALDRCKEGISKPNAIQLHKELNAIKREQFPFMYEVSKCAPQEALRDLQIAFDRFFKKTSGYPKFKSKHKSSNSFRLGGSFKVERNKIRLPRLGWIRLKESNYIPIDRRILSATLREEGNRWYCSVLVEENIQPLSKTDEVLGIDLGIKQLATCSDGFVVNNPKSLSRHEKKIKRLQRIQSRRQKGSNRRKKIQKQLRKVWKRVTDIRKDNIHKSTSYIVKTKQYGTIVLEDLHVKGMVKNHNLAKSIHDASMSEFRRCIEYKAKWYGVEIIKADRWYPSTKACSKCGCVKEKISLSERIYSCDHCGHKMDRDLNAAINLKKYTASSAGINAHGDDKVHSNMEGGRRRSEKQTQELVSYC